MTKHTNRILSYAPLVLVLTIAFYFVLPKSWNFIIFFIPTFYFGKVMTREGKGFNFYVVLFVFLLSIVLPTGFFTLDASGNDIIQASEPTLDLMFTFGFWINLIVGILVFAVPALLIGAIGWAYYQGKIEEGTSMLVKVILAMLIFFVVCTILDWFGMLPDWFIWRYIRDFFIYVGQIFTWFGDGIAGLFDGSGFNAFPELPDFGGASLQEIVNNQIPELSASNMASGAPNFFLHVNAMIPFILAGFSFYLWCENKWGKDPYNVINKYMGGDEPEKDYEIKIVKFNAPAVILGTIILIYAFGIFLTYTNTGMDMGLYLIITIFCLILIIVGIIPLKTGTLSKTLEGCAFGVTGIFLFYQLLTSGLSVIDPADMSLPIQLLNQIMFTAPTESLIFHVVVPSLGLLVTYYFYRRSDKRNKIETLEKKQKQLELLESKLRELFNQIVISNVKTIKYKGKSYSQNELSSEIFNTTNQIEILKLQQVQKSKISMNQLIFSKTPFLILSIALAIILPNFIFATYHSFRSPYNFLDFWGSGIAFVYFGAGAWLTFISIRYGWLPCILSHALVNILSIILSGVFV